MGIKRSNNQNKFEAAVAELDRQEAAAQEKSGDVVERIAGTRTRTIVDKNGRTREIKVAEKRKTLPVYIPESLYEQFDKITTAYGKSNNAAIVELIRDYVTEKKNILDEL